MLVDHRVAQLLCSRLCHDLSGPAGAVTTGLELVEEGGEELVEAMDLVQRSARQVVSRIAFYRVAFGASGIGAETSVEEVRTLSRDHLDGGRVDLDWPDGDGFPATMPIAPPGGMIFLNMLLVGVDALPRGGVLQVRLASVGDDLGLAMTAKGDGASLRAEQRVAMQPEARIEELSARTVPGYCISRVAGDLGIAVEVSDGGDGEVRMAAILPGR